MSEWWTYRLTSFLLFSPRTYHRLFELYNIAIWPAQLAGAVIGIAIVALLVGRLKYRDRAIAGLLAVCWAWTSWAFLYQRYTQINWVAPWFALAFAIEALLLAGLGLFARRVVFDSGGSSQYRIAIALIIVAIAGYPLLASLTGRPWTTAETFGVTPDPTAIATAAALALVHRRVRWLLLVVPLLWCAISWATLWAMQRPEAYAVAIATLVAVLAITLRRGAAPKQAAHAQGD